MWTSDVLEIYELCMFSQSLKSVALLKTCVVKMHEYWPGFFAHIQEAGVARVCAIVNTTSSRLSSLHR
jgi:hypothetical protein